MCDLGCIRSVARFGEVILPLYSALGNAGSSAGLSVRDMHKKERAQQRAMKIIKGLEHLFNEERQRERAWEENSSTYIYIYVYKI